MCRYQQLFLLSCVPFQNVPSHVLSAVSHKTLSLSCFGITVAFSIYQTYIFPINSFRPIENYAKSLTLAFVHDCLMFFFTLQMSLGRIFKHSISTQQDQCEVVTKISVYMSKPRDFGREAFLTWGRSRNGRSILEWTSGSPLHALPFTRFSCVSFGLL